MSDRNSKPLENEGISSLVESVVTALVSNACNVKVRKLLAPKNFSRGE